MRRLTTFTCAGDTLAATLDEAPGSTGLLIVSGGNEVRHGAHRGMAMLAARLGASGTSVFRYDRRGVGDSEGENRGWRSAGDDLRAAAVAFQAAAPQVTRLVAFGNCDAAALLALEGRSAGVDRVLLANPWTIEEIDGLPPAAAIRAGYARQLRDPREWLRALRGGMDFRKAINGLAKLARTRSQPQSLTEDIVSAIETWGQDATVILAERDATALAYAAAARGRTIRTVTVPTASHSFARPADKTALERAVRTLVA